VWNIKDSRDLYNIEGWSQDYFDVNEDGDLCVRPDGENRVSLPAIMRDLVEKGAAKTPCVLRFPQLLRARIHDLGKAFSDAAGEFGFRGGHQIVFPLKVNQHRRLVEDIMELNKEEGTDHLPVGLECGSKPELMVSMAMMTTSAMKGPIICNGFKDATYIGAALGGSAAGLQVMIVVDEISELDTIIEMAREMDVEPSVGLRVKLVSRGSGVWERSGGQSAKFGLTSADLIHCMKRLKESGLGASLKRLHFHIGAQVTRAQSILRAVNEAARVYTRVVDQGFGIEYFNIGGGLGGDYEGTLSTHNASANYGMQEYANHVVYTLSQVCNEEGAPHPIIVTESGRALAAFQAVTVVEVRSRTPGLPSPTDFTPGPDEPRIIDEMYLSWRDVDSDNYLEYLHDIIFFKERLDMHFMEGKLTLEEKAKGDGLFRETCSRIAAIARKEDDLGAHLQTLEDAVSIKYIANFSAFQSVPDAWGINQLFPVMPLQDLHMEPTARAALADITCDSDGMIKEYVSTEEEEKKTLEVHPFRDNGEPYFMGIFLTGAYQEVMGDYHNLLGRPYRASILITGPGTWRVDTVEEGERSSEILEYFNYDRDFVRKSMDNLLASSGTGENHAANAARAQRLGKLFEDALDDYSYLTD